MADLIARALGRAALRTVAPEQKERLLNVRRDRVAELGHNFGYNTSDGESSCAFHRDIGSQALVFVGTRGRQVGWLASQADMLADDWHIVE